jgi:hypothetical protein
MKITGILEKMISKAESPVVYALAMGESKLELNAMIGQEIELSYTGKIFCVNCGKATKKSFSQGHCFPCSIKLASCDMCILKPELCHYDKGTCREPAWGEEHCLRPHVIYLANSSGLKVGITRRTQVPYRWIDQGASSALAILEVKNRLTSGQIEVLFKQHISDKTDWRKMLKGEPEQIDLLAEKNRLLNELKVELSKIEHTVLNEPVVQLTYPVLSYPLKVSSLSLEKNAVIKDKLVGIKGQYLIFEKGVFNVRAHSGHEVTIQGV